MPKPRLLLAATLAVAALVVPALDRAARADEGDRAGWSVATDPRKRAFLMWVPKANGPRLLLFACLRDADTFAVYSTGLPGLAPNLPHAKLTLSFGDKRFAIEGTVDPEPGGSLPTFTADTDQDAAGRARIARELLPVLEAPGPATLEIAGAPPVAVTLLPQPPFAGIAEPLAVFRRICFGK